MTSLKRTLVAAFLASTALAGCAKKEELPSNPNDNTIFTLADRPYLAPVDHFQTSYRNMRQALNDSTPEDSTVNVKSLNDESYRVDRITLQTMVTLSEQGPAGLGTATLPAQTACATTTPSQARTTEAYNKCLVLSEIAMKKVAPPEGTDAATTELNETYLGELRTNMTTCSDNAATVGADDAKSEVFMSCINSLNNSLNTMAQIGLPPAMPAPATNSWDTEEKPEDPKKAKRDMTAAAKKRITKYAGDLRDNMTTCITVATKVAGPAQATATSGWSSILPFGASPAAAPAAPHATATAPAAAPAPAAPAQTSKPGTVTWTPPVPVSSGVKFNPAAPAR